jgi:hypothetical protein
MPSTYIPIATQTLGSDAASVTFSSIPQIYTDLVLVTNEKQTGSPSVRSSAMQFNSDTASNYSFTEMYGDGGTVGSVRASTGRIYYAYDVIANTSNFGLTTITHIMNYSNTTTNKTTLTRASNATSGASATIGMWRSTAAISSIFLYLDNLSSFATGSTFSLYGIASAAASAKATGGNFISTDGIYYYHTFLSSGTFTPNQALTCDYLVIGGGASGWLGGGGAGGLRSTVSATGGGGSVESPLSLLSGTNYTVTIGAGGAPQGIAGNNSVFATITSTGGGAGSSGGNTGGNGGSGGGGGYGLAGGSGTTGQGFAGGTGSTSGGNATGGGGGAGAVGTNSSSGNGGNGGAGVANSITGSSVTYAGGGGAYGSVSAGTGGAGGGGNGSAGGTGGSGTVNTGSGGAGGGSVGGAGGSGLVIVRYAV